MCLFALLVIGWLMHVDLQFLDDYGDDDEEGEEDSGSGTDSSDLGNAS